jgi:ankyrin repeat protein
VLRHCLPASIRQTLDQLPQSLDETYVRVLSQISQANQAHAHRMLQCLLVAVRPLHVEELAELLAFEFDAAQGGIPKYRAAWRLDDQTQAVLSTCSSLVTIVDDNSGWYWQPRRQIVQFSHFSVKEFLLSNRLTSHTSISRYRIRLVPAHTILTKACLGFLHHLDEPIDEESAEGFPFAEYAARHWVEHAQFKDVASRVKDGMETLFDPDKPYFAAWIGIHDMDNINKRTGHTPSPPSSYRGRSPGSSPCRAPIPYWGPSPYRRPSAYRAPSPPRFPDSKSDSESEISKPNPLYYAVLCGFYDLAKHLVVKFPQYVNAIYGRYEFPLFAALSEDFLEVGRLLLEHGASVDARETTGKTILLKVFSQPHRSLVDIVTLLLKHGADVNSQDRNLTSALHLAEYTGELEVARMLLKHKADVNSRDQIGKTPLHVLSERQPRIYHQDDILDHARLLLKHGADMNRQDSRNQTPLHLAMKGGWFQLARILLDHGADVSSEDIHGATPLDLLLASRIHDSDALGLVWPLPGHDAVVNGGDENKQTPLFLEVRGAWFKLARILREHRADTSVDNNDGATPLHLLLASQIHDEGGALHLLWLLLGHGAAVNKRDNSNQTPLLLAMGRGWFKLARILLEHGSDANVVDNNGNTPLHVLSECQIYDKSDVGDDKDIETPLPRLRNHGADNSMQGENPMMLQCDFGRLQVAQALLDHGANINAGNNVDETSLYRELEGKYHVRCDLLGHVQRLTKPSRRRTRTKYAPPNAVTLGIVLWKVRYRTITA